MPHLRFQHVFAGLLLMSVVTAFVLPVKYSNRTHPEIQALFAPVSVPVRAIARRIHDAVAPDSSSDHRADDDIRRENQLLRSELSRVGEQLHTLEGQVAAKKELGTLGEYTTKFSVIGGDPGLRESLQIRGSSLEGLKEHMPVLYTDGSGIVGEVQRAGVAGAQIRLITDAGFGSRDAAGYTLRAGFKRYVTENGQVKAVTLKTPQVLVQGVGKNQMVIRLLPMDAVTAAGLRVGDVAVLDEANWPPILKGIYLGTITSIEKSKATPQFAEIFVEPQKALIRLREVLVMTKSE